jgi:hypothetical protein
MRSQAQVAHRPREIRVGMLEDGHLALVLAVLRPLSINRRERWMKNRLPMTMRMLRVGLNWEALSDLDAMPHRSALR